MKSILVRKPEKILATERNLLGWTTPLNNTELETYPLEVTPGQDTQEENLNFFTNLKENSRAHLNTLQEKKNFLFEENPELNENLKNPAPPLANT